MGIDGIGGKPSVIPPADVTGSVSVGGPNKEFSISEAREPVAVREATLLDKLSAGEISKEDYLEAQVEQAVGHLEGVVPEAQLSMIKDHLRSQLEADPGLSRLVQQATGVVPSKHER